MTLTKKSQAFLRPLLNSVVHVHIFDEQSSLVISKPHVAKQVQHILNLEKIAPQEVMIHFVSTERISELHEQFFDDPTPTDCISFPIDQEILGEVFVCTDVAVSYAKEHQLDPYDEASLYVVHGLLHLMGYDDIEEKDRSMMRKKEKSCMQSLMDHHLGMHPTHFQHGYGETH